MKKYKLISNITLPSILCAIVIYITNIPLEYSTLTFGLIIGLANWGFHKYKPIIGVLLSMLVSFVSFLLAYLSFAATKAIFNLLNVDSDSVLSTTLSINIIAPLLLFLSYTFVFKIPKTRLTTFIVILSLVLLVFQSYLHYYFDSLSIDFQYYKILKIHTIWQIIMALAIQLLVNQSKINKS